MKEEKGTSRKFRLIVYGLLIFTFSLSIQSCSTMYKSRIRVENDIVKSSKRIKKDIYYRKTLEKNTPLFYASQTILKEIKPDNHISYKVYDFLSMSSNSYILEDKMYLIIEEEVIPIEIDYMEALNTSRISEDTESILTADSTSMSVVTGYTHYNRKNYKISYELSPETIVMISNSDRVYFRYYSGPNMITTKLNGSDLRRLKKMIQMI